MKRKGSTYPLLVAKKKKIDDEKATLADLLLLYESGRDAKQLTACKCAASYLEFLGSLAV
jgi:hypothetical protein